MHVTLRPAIERFIEEQVKAGRYPNREAVIEAAIAELQCRDDLDPQTVAAINRAEAQADRGEGMDLAEFRARFNRRIAEE